MANRATPRASNSAGRRRRQAGPFATKARKVLENGFNPIPVYRGEKRPAIRGWQTYATAGPDEDEFARWMQRYPDHSVGIVCGAVVAIDIDVDDADFAEQLERLTVENLGDTPLGRIGAEPRRLLVYGAVSPIRSDKAETVFGDLEVLGQRKQFVAFGTHPKSGKPYRWVTADPTTVRRDDLPCVDQSDIDEFLRLVEGTVGGDIGGADSPAFKAKDRAGPQVKFGTILEGRRNDELFRLALRHANRADDIDALIETIKERNRLQCEPPLGDEEVERLCKSAWGYYERDESWLGKESRAQISLIELVRLGGHADATLLLMTLRAVHGHLDGESFILANNMSKRFSWGRKRFAKARDCLVDLAFIRCTHRGGAKPNDPPRYKLL